MSSSSWTCTHVARYRVDGADVTLLELRCGSAWRLVTVQVPIGQAPFGELHVEGVRVGLGEARTVAPWLLEAIASTPWPATLEPHPRWPRVDDVDVLRRMVSREHSERAS